MNTCICCGRPLRDGKRSYCSTQCMNTIKNKEKQRYKNDKRVKENELKKDFSIKDYCKWDARRREQGLPHISYGKLQAMKNRG